MVRMIRAVLGIAAAVAAMAAVIAIAVNLPNINLLPQMGFVVSGFAAGCVGTFVGRTRWSGLIPVAIFAAIVVLVVVYFIDFGSDRFPNMLWWRPLGIPICMLVACWCGTLLAGRYIPVVDKIDLEDLQRAFD